jgi:dTDP-4-dehydrorhamnose 3,5-epimerase
MLFKETAFPGVFVVEMEHRPDTRGYFARSYCRDEFRRAGLHADFPQCNVSYNIKRGTLRGMHYQDDPLPEPKLVRCARGAIYDVVVDLRRGSPTFRRWLGVELNDDNGRSLYVPPGFAHGFQTLADHCDVFYMMGERYHPELARGVRWDDPAFAITWPIENPILSERDQSYPDFRA